MKAPSKPLTPQQLRVAKQKACQTWYFQSYNQLNQTEKVSLPNQCMMADIIGQQQCQQQKAYNRAQDLLHQYRVNPQKYPLTSWTYQNGLTKAQQRQYSNNWYRQQGTSCAMGSTMNGTPASINANWPGMYIPGSQTTYTDGFLSNTGYN
jgi:hypothetical protein